MSYLRKLTMIYLIISIFILTLVFKEPIYKFIFVPRREADFAHRHYEYWFDEMIAYSSLTNNRFKLEFRRNNKCDSKEYIFRHNQDHYDRAEHEIQEAYKQHIHKKFEEIVL